MLYPFLFRPVFQERIWGGRALERLYGKPIPAGARIGESWEISDRPEAQSVVANGPLAGRTLEWLMQNHERELLGHATALNGRFPLLVKILDAEEKLSLQVHPPAEKARGLGGEPKTEIWYIAEAQPGAELYVGLRRGTTRREFEQGIRSGNVADCFHRVKVQSGDAMFIPSGRVHAIGAGLVIFEIQQNSDTTYRVFDWNRLDKEGRPRQLHVRESLECIDYADFEPTPLRAEAGSRRRLVDDPLFTVDVVNLAAEDKFVERLKSCEVFACVRGRVNISPNGQTVSLKAGDFGLLPACLGEALIQATEPAQVVIATPGP